jgi:16S rRNA (adenine1518-N6/adenine1519-N6)-dimethyltransferase
VPSDVALLGPADVRRLAGHLGVRPTKVLGQNFMHDANTVRRIARLAEVGPDDVVLEVGPGLGSLTLALLETGARVVAVEIDPVLAGALGEIVGQRAPSRADRLTIVTGDALQVTASQLTGGAGTATTGMAPAGPAVPAVPAVPAGPAGPAVPAVPAVPAGPAVPAVPAGPAVPAVPAVPVPPSALVANLPYNVAVPIVLTLLERLPSLRRGLVLVQAEVADRLAAGPGEPAYGVPSVKVAWYAEARRAGAVPRSVFWPVPNVDSGLVSLARRRPPPTEVTREDVFACVEAAFSQRRKTLRAALAGWAGSPGAAGELVRAAGIDPRTRGEQLSLAQFAAIAQARALGCVDCDADVPSQAE